MFEIGIRWKVLLIAACQVAAWPAAHAADAADPAKLTVGTKVAAPFVIRADDGSWAGLTYELWQRVADRLEVEFEVREADIEGLLSGVERGELDVAVAALTVTSERERRVDFTHPFYATGLGIAVPDQAGSGWGAVLHSLVSREFLTVVAALGLLLLACGLLVWALERRRNPEQFGGTAAEGIGSGFWWAAVTMTTVGYGDKAPATAGGRIAALIWMFASLIVISTFTAAIASSLTVGSLQGPIQGPDDLGRGRVGTVQGTAAEGALASRGIRPLAYPSIDAALDAVGSGEIDAVVYDAPILRYLTARVRGGGVTVLPGVFERQDYAFAVASGSPLRERINVALLEVLYDPGWRERIAHYLGR